MRWQSCYKAVDKCSQLQPFSFTYLIPGTLRSFLRPGLACGVCSPGVVWVQVGVFLCSARNNLLCDTLQGPRFVAACVQVGCFKMLHQRKLFSADSMDNKESELLWCFCTMVWTSTWGGLVLCVRKLLFNSQHSEGLLTQRPGGKWLNLAFTRDIFDEISQFPINFFPSFHGGMEWEKQKWGIRLKEQEIF